MKKCKVHHKIRIIKKVKGKIVEFKECVLCGKQLTKYGPVGPLDK
jgi:hypothetical protein